MAKKRDLWPELCKLVEADDGLPTRDVGPWTEQKLFLWNRYIDITTQGMKRKPWSAIVYVDLFAGPGVCTIRKSGRRIPGSVLIAAYASKPFDLVIGCELDEDLASACRKRLDASPVADTSHVIIGDCNHTIDQVTALIPDRSLTLAFVDPPGLHAHFATIEHLTRERQVDLLVLFADRVDIVRNVESYANQSKSNLDLVLGPDCPWRESWGNLANQNPENTSRLLSDLYKVQLQDRLGYSEFDSRTMRTAHGPLYQIIFATKHSRGLEFWLKIATKHVGGQRDLF